MARSKEREDIKCRHCGKVFYPRFNHIKCCSKKCGYESRPKYQVRKHGSIFMSSGGYKMVAIWEGNKKTIMKEHRYIMEQHLGRKLLENEVVHHRNEIKTDNRIENLEVMTKNEHMRHHKNEDWKKIRADHQKLLDSNRELLEILEKISQWRKLKSDVFTYANGDGNNFDNQIKSAINNAKNI